MSLLKSLPKVDKFIKHKDFESCATKLLTKLAKEAINNLRNEILSKNVTTINEEALRFTVLKNYENITTASLQKLINATGVIVHTNLGRSLIDEAMFEKVKSLATSYNNLEYDIKKGQRGERYTHISKVITELLGCEDVLIVNNNASAVFLILNTFAKKKQVIVSRGELVEIGGSFRVPEVMNNSGAKLKEVGSTNKTHLKDYKEAIGEKTSMLMKVHKSNYSIEGFTKEVSYEELIELAKDNGIIDYYDMGSGHLIDLPYGLDQYEPSVAHYMKSNPSLLSFSGDKLLGGVQAGIIVGKKEYIEKLKKNQLLRMLRVDKLTLALLEENIKATLLEEYDSIPTLKMLFTTTETLTKRATTLAKKLPNAYTTEVKESKTVIGGGTTPNKKIPTIIMSIEFNSYKANKIETLFRKNGIIGRIEDDKFLLDFRTIQNNELETIENIMKELINE